MNIPALFELCCASIASLYKGKNFNKIKKEIDGNPSLEFEKYTILDDQALMLEHTWILEDIGEEEH